MRLRTWMRAPLLLALSLPVCSRAETTPLLTENADPWCEGRLLFQIENDRFALGTDHYYTNGMRLAWITGDLNANGDVPGPIAAITSLFPGQAREDDIYRTRLALGQDIFTPFSLVRWVPDPNDRPYAGWLYGSAGIGRYNEDTTDVLELSLGMVGPASLAEETQVWWHATAGAQVAADAIRGWDDQLHNEFGVILAYQKRWLFQGEIYAPLFWDASVGGGGALGNIYTYANAAGTFRFGFNLPPSQPYEPIGPARSMGEAYARVVPEGFRKYFILGVEGRAIARNIFLDGNTFGDSPSVSKEYFVGEARLGGGFQWDWFTFEYAFVARSKEFKTQQEGYQLYGSVVGSIQF